MEGDEEMSPAANGRAVKNSPTTVHTLALRARGVVEPAGELRARREREGEGAGEPGLVPEVCGLQVQVQSN